MAFEWKWDEIVERKIEEVGKERFTLRYEEKSEEGDWIHRTFRLKKVEPFLYATYPLILNYNLYVDVETESRKKGVEKLENIWLGTFFNRPKIKFAEEYFKDTYPALIKIIVESHGEDWERYDKETALPYTQTGTHLQTA
jgi:hypothetical protein